jgi:methyl-accepting chemotaxis protein
VLSKNHQEKDYLENIIRWVRFADKLHSGISGINKSIYDLSFYLNHINRNIQEEFKALIQIASEKTDNILKKKKIISELKIEGEYKNINESSHIVKQTYKSSINDILNISKKTANLIFTLDDAIETSSQIERCINSVEAINHKTKYLSLNATIEAVRAGEAGESFQIIANEVRELSNDIQSLATNIRQQVTVMSENLLSAQNTLKDISSIDFSSSIIETHKLDSIMDSIVQDRSELTAFNEDAIQYIEEFKNILEELFKKYPDNTNAEKSAEIIQTKVSEWGSKSIGLILETINKFPNLDFEKTETELSSSFSEKNLKEGELKCSIL